MVAAEAPREGRGPYPLPDRRFLPDQRDLPQQPNDAALLGRAGPRRVLQGGGGVTALFQHWGATYEWSWFFSMLIGILVIAFPLMLAVAMIIYAERKVWAAIALWRGPNVVGPCGPPPSFAGGLQGFLKETIVSTSAHKRPFLLAPTLTPTLPLL